MANPLWTVVLAAGAGRRLSAVTGGVPKQFWRGLGGRSLLEQTLDRFGPLARPEGMVVIVDASHREYVSDSSWRHAPVGTTLFQPQDRGTAVGILLGLVPVFADDADSLVAITPSDHGVIDDAGFRQGILEAARFARSRQAIVVFGVEPTVAHHDYGWITPGPFQSAGRIRALKSFVEKPEAARAAALFADGAIWNTMLVVAPARALRDLYAELHPELIAVFEHAVKLSPSDRDEFLAAAYTTLPRVDFSRDVLSRASRLSTYVWPTTLGWSDLGTPVRLREWQARTRMVAAAHSNSPRLESSAGRRPRQHHVASTG